MNKVIFTGNITKETTINNGVLKNTIAVQRSYKNKNTGEYETDFIDFTAFSHNATFLEGYANIGDKIEIIGRLQTGNYVNSTGDTVYTKDVIVEETSILHKVVR